MRQTDGEIHPAALERERVKTIKLYSGLVIAAAGLVAVFLLKEVYLGFAVALIGTGLVPFEKLNPWAK